MCPACRMLLSCCANSRKRCMLKYGNNRPDTALLSTRRHDVPSCAARWRRRRSWLHKRLRRRVRRPRAASTVAVDRRGRTSKTRPKSELCSAHMLARASIARGSWRKRFLRNVWWLLLIRLALPKKVPQKTLVSALLSHDASKKHTKLEGTARATPRLARLIGICPTRGCCRPTSASSSRAPV